jgi:hypothetical protein
MYHFDEGNELPLFYSSSPLNQQFHFSSPLLSPSACVNVLLETLPFGNFANFV